MGSLNVSINHRTDEVALLMIEDDEIDATAIKRAFTKRGLKTTLLHVSDGIEALEILRGENGKIKLQAPFIILLDLNMPRLNGIELLTQLRQDPELHSSIVFVLTTSSADQDRLAAYDFQIAGYMVKADMRGDYDKVIELLDNYWAVVTLP